MINTRSILRVVNLITVRVILLGTVHKAATLAIGGRFLLGIQTRFQGCENPRTHSFSKTLPIKLRKQSDS